MSELIIKNKAVLKMLNQISDEITSQPITKNRFRGRKTTFYPEDARTDGEKYLDPKYLKKHLNDPNHVGYPVENYGIPLSDPQEDGPDPLESVQKFVKSDFVHHLGATSDALFLYYPPGGFVGWHTNQNNSGYQIVFSWSESGDGYFQVYDKEKEEVIRYYDQPGWNCRHQLFGREEHEHCWHSAYTRCPKITVCVLFRWREQPHKKDLILHMKDELLEELVREE